MLLLLDEDAAIHTVDAPRPSSAVTRDHLDARVEDHGLPVDSGVSSARRALCSVFVRLREVRLKKD